MKAQQLLVAVMLVLVVATTGNASIIININQVGNDVVASGNGNANTIDLSFNGPLNPPSLINASAGAVFIGGSGVPDGYTGISGSQSFGIGGTAFADTVTGFGFGVVYTFNAILLPSGYVSGDSLSASSTWNNTTFASLGVTPGTYTWTWGSGANADFLTLNIGQTAVPEPSTYILLSIALGAVGFVRRKMNKQS